MSDGKASVTGLQELAEAEWFSDLSDEATYWVFGSDQCEKNELAERREEHRERSHLEVRIMPGGRLGTVDDISIGGVLVYTEKPVEPGCPVSLNLLTLNGVVKAHGVVRWVTKGSFRDLQQAKTGMGVQFTWVSLEMRELLEYAYRRSTVPPFMG